MKIDNNAVLAEIAFSSRQDMLAHYAEVRRRLNPLPMPKPKPVLTVVETPPVAKPKIDPAVASLFEEIEAMKAAQEKRQSIIRIQTVVASHFGFSLPDLISHNREARLTLARHIGMFLAHKLTIQTLSAIGRYFGGRDHSTIICAIRRVKKLIETDADFCAEVEAVMAELS